MMFFEKYQANGNDFIITTASDSAHVQRMIEKVPKWCDRHLGIGADGVLIFHESNSDKSNNSAEMTIVNADGSIARNCGNGLRCFAAWMKKHAGFDGVRFSIAIPAGLQHVRVHRCATLMGEAFDVEVSMPFPEVIAAFSWQYRQEVPLSCLYVDVGNPHIIVDCAASELSVDVFQKQRAHLIAQHGFLSSDEEGFVSKLPSQLPKAVNVTAVKLMSSHRDSACSYGVKEGVGDNLFDRTLLQNATLVKAATHERGVGPTLACGSASVAVAAWVVFQHFASQELPESVSVEHFNIAIKNQNDFLSVVDVCMPGGNLLVSLSRQEKRARAMLRGPAVHVYSGNLDD